MEDLSAFANIIETLGTIGVLIYAWQLTRLDSASERTRAENILTAERNRSDALLQAERMRSDALLQAERARGDKLQLAIIRMFSKTAMPADGDDDPKATQPKSGL